MSEKTDPSKEERLRSAQKTATIFGVLAIVAMVGVVYGFLQKEAYDKVKTSLENRDQQLMQCRKYSESVEKALGEQKVLLNKAISDLKAANDKKN